MELRCGSKVTLYMPSTVVGDGGVTGSGGYEGQSGYALKSGRPFVATLEITDTVYNPLRREGVDVDDFARNNGGLKPREAARRRRGARRGGDYPIYDPNNPYYDGFAWRNAADSIPQVYINVIYKPTERFRYPEIYASQYEPYPISERPEQAICDTLVNRFGPYDGPQKLKSDSVTLNGTAKIWYIARFLDGFVLDSNIPGVRGPGLRREGGQRLGRELHPFAGRHDRGVLLLDSRAALRPVGGDPHHFDQRLRRRGQGGYDEHHLHGRLELQRPAQLLQLHAGLLRRQRLLQRHVQRLLQ